MLLNLGSLPAIQFLTEQFLITGNASIMPSRVSMFHSGEAAMRSELKVPPGENPTALGLPMSSGMRIMASPLVAVGTLDDEGRPWTTVWGGEREFAQPIATNVLAMNSAVDTEHDPVYKAIWAGVEGGVVQPGPDARMMAALSIDLMSRDRVKVMGNMVAAAQTEEGIQMAMVVAESTGNCPKYLNKKEIRPHQMHPELVAEGLPLPQEALDLVAKSDLFFMSTTNGESMDTNHRGGPPGFMRVLKNEEGGVELVYPEYSGNRLYQSLGNLKINPLIGVVIPDFDTSDVLYLTGSASILVGDEALSLIARTRLALKITVTSARFVKSGLPFRGSPVDHSPYNPAVRHLLTEQTGPLADSPAQPDITASLVRRESLTPTVNVFTFDLSSRDPLPKWHAGQHITFDFEPELGTGYSHMRDDDPQSLNDDLVRTFTVSSPPGAGSLSSSELQITARRHGPATAFLWRHNVRVPLEIPVLGFGGEESFRLPTTTAPSAKKPVFIARGVGITPLLAQGKAVLEGGVDLRLLWGVRAEDLALVTHTFTLIPGLASRTKLFVTGKDDDGEALQKVEGLGAKVERRRIEAGDVEGLKGQGRSFYLCAGTGLLGMLSGWLDGEDFVTEDFSY